MFKNKMPIKKTLGFLLGVGLIYLLLLIYPNFLFAHHYEYKNYQVYSDKLIDEKIELVIDDAISRIEHSELYDANHTFRVYLCNANWRFQFFTRNGNAGGIVNYFISSNIFIRENDITKNQLIPPKTWVNPLTDRPLSYFIAHETVHSLQRKYDPFLIFKVPVEIIEGYADYIAKGKTINIQSLMEDYQSNSPTMDPKNGLYDRYYLYIYYWIEQQGYDFERIVREQPNLEETLKGWKNRF